MVGSSLVAGEFKISAQSRVLTPQTILGMGDTFTHEKEWAALEDLKGLDNTSKSIDWTMLQLSGKDV
jgi:hypothetical protein